ncbi:thioredoxin domain-containing protein [Breoghania sp. L-A4]|uniref:thioredoxin domain-containing protein n=1 Tax=Breoghania sp. L-A4 TaxID=2304600 RepID=UPI000E35AEB4|nr:thioredoxin domain-containing protein [Breoghania sp. L-A4]AXS38810.1 thioredoxin domain-containing protein [Breoghania sp. L-A4]
MTENLLAHETSPYLLQHKDNPVHWRPWNAQALQAARDSGKPILLSVGYAACHWCHVMAHESFEDAEVAEVMNRLFICIKVDREERPDIDQIYMNALHALGEQGGWPLTMFLTPRGEPFWGGTYFPKQSRWGRPGFIDVMQQIADVHATQPDKVASNAQALMQALKRRKTATEAPLTWEILDTASERLLGLIDPVNGGTRGAPKFPQGSILELLWRAGKRTGNSQYDTAFLHSLRRIASGGIYDHLGGGFARYSVDEQWLAPHFEKMLYDNAQLLELMCEAWADTGDDLFRLRIEETIGWLEREMRQSGGGFASSLDADSEGEEGRFYVWDASEIEDLLPADDYALFAAWYDVTPGGNWEGKTILNRLQSESIADPETEARLADMRATLLDHRAGRVRPALDDKVLADWNGMTICALVRAAELFSRESWAALARDAYQFVTDSMTRDGRLGHSWRADKTLYPGLASDYAEMIRASLCLHRLTNNPEYLEKAQSFEKIIYEYQWDNDNFGYFLTASDADDLIIRPKSALDDATPNPNGVMVSNLVRLWQITGEDLYRERADAVLTGLAPDIHANIFGAASLLNAFDFRLDPVRVIVVAGKPDAALEEILNTAPARNLVLQRVTDTTHLPDRHPAKGKQADVGRTTVYVCRGESCSLPVTDATSLRPLLG